MLSTVIVLSSDDDDVPPAPPISHVTLPSAASSNRKRKSEAERLQPFAFDRKPGRLGPAWETIQPGKARERKASSPKTKFGDYATDSMIDSVLGDATAEDAVAIPHHTRESSGTPKWFSENPPLPLPCERNEPSSLEELVPRFVECWHAATAAEDRLQHMSGRLCHRTAAAKAEVQAREPMDHDVVLVHPKSLGEHSTRMIRDKCQKYMEFESVAEASTTRFANAELLRRTEVRRINRGDLCGQRGLYSVGSFECRTVFPVTCRTVLDLDYHEHLTGLRGTLHDKYSYDFQTRVDGYELVADLAEHGNPLLFMNDPRGSDNVANMSFVEVTWKGWPYLFAMATQQIADGEELLVEYGNDYWTECSNTRKTREELVALQRLVHGNTTSTS